jgi:hypothetical protein
MKLEQDTDTKADIGLETNDFGDRWSTGQVTDKWWKTHKGEQAKEPDIITTKADRWLGTNYKIGKRINWETRGQRRMARDTWPETSESTQKTSGEPDTTRQRGTNKGRQANIRRAGHHKHAGIKMKGDPAKKDIWRKETSEDRHPKSRTSQTARQMKEDKRAGHYILGTQRTQESWFWNHVRYFAPKSTK